MSDSDTILQARVIAGVTVGCISVVVLIVLATVRYIRRRRAGGRIIVNELRKDLELEAGDSVPQTPGEDDVGKSTCKNETQSPQPEPGVIREEGAQMVQQTPRSDVRVVYVSLDLNFISY